MESTESIEYMYISELPNKSGEYHFLIPKQGVTRLHNVWLKNTEYTIKSASFITCDLCHETLTSSSIQVLNNGLRTVPFFFTKANGGFPMMNTPYHEIGIDVVLNEPLSNPLTLGMCVSMMENLNTFDKLVEESIKNPIVLS